MARKRARSRGQGLVEFAIVFPLFVLMLFALFDIGRAVFAYNEITGSAREGARLALVNQDVATIKTRITAQSTGTAVNSCVYFLDSAATYTTCTQGTTPPASGLLCPIPGGPSTTPSVGCIAHIEVWTDYAPLTPVISNLIGSFRLTANSQSAIEFVCPNPAIPSWSTAASCPKQP